MLQLPIEHRNDPFPFLARLRRDEPVLYDAEDRTWSVFRYDDVRTVLKDFQRFSSDPAVLQPPPPGFDASRPSLIRLDPPDHRKLRTIVAPTFTPSRLAYLEPAIARMAHGMIDAVAARGRMDVIDDLAFPLPVTVIAELLGVPPSDREMYRQWADTLIGRQRRFRLTEPPPEEVRRVMAEMDAYFAEVIADRRRRPRRDLISDWVAHIGPDGLSDAEVISLCSLMLLAGHVTTVNLIGNAVWSLLEWPHELQRLRQRPDLLPGAIEEVLRYRGPVLALVRFTTTDVELGGQRIPAGRMVVAWMASANRDEAVFAGPDRFDVGRNPREHLAFGTGIHVCLGAPLARLEGHVVLRILLERLHELDWVDADVRQSAGQRLLFGLERLPISFRAAPAVAA